MPVAAPPSSRAGRSRRSTVAIARLLVGIVSASMVDVPAARRRHRRQLHVPVDADVVPASSSAPPPPSSATLAIPVEYVVAGAHHDVPTESGAWCSASRGRIAGVARRPRHVYQSAASPGDRVLPGRCDGRRRPGGRRMRRSRLGAAVAVGRRSHGLEALAPADLRPPRATHGDVQRVLDCSRWIAAVASSSPTATSKAAQPRRCRRRWRSAGEARGRPSPTAVAGVVVVAGCTWRSTRTTGAEGGDDAEFIALSSHTIAAVAPPPVRPARDGDRR